MLVHPIMQKTHIQSLLPNTVWILIISLARPVWNYCSHQLIAEKTLSKYKKQVLQWNKSEKKTKRYVFTEVMKNQVFAQTIFGILINYPSGSLGRGVMTLHYKTSSLWLVICCEGHLWGGGEEEEVGSEPLVLSIIREARNAPYRAVKEILRKKK